MRGYIFDFDETLAHTDICIGISRLFNGTPVDPAEWLPKIDIDPGEALGFKKLENHSIVYTESGVFSKYLENTRESIELGDLRRSEPGFEKLHGLEDIIDYSPISRIHSPTPIEPLIEIGRRAFANGHIVGIVTARSSKSHLQSIEGNFVSVTCRDDIQAFLAKNGLPVEKADIHCVGDRPGAISDNKARTVLYDFIEKYNLDVVDFFDDSRPNLLAVASLDCGPTRVNVHDSKEIYGLKDFGWLLGSSIKRRLLRKSASRIRELSGLNKL